jgi:hypothetical protein
MASGRLNRRPCGPSGASAEELADDLLERLNLDEECC